MNKINQYLLAQLLVVVTAFFAITFHQTLTQEARRNSAPEKFAVNSMIRPYVAEYQMILQSHGIELPWGKVVVIDFTPTLPSGTLGVAWGMDVDEVTVISINMSDWRHLTNQERRIVVFHELTHDLFNLQHFSTPLMDTPMPMTVTKQLVDSAMAQLIEILK